MCSGRWYHGTREKFGVFVITGLGVHLGSAQQAKSAPGGKDFIAATDVVMKKPLRLDDLYSWDPWDLTVLMEEMFSIDLNALKMEIILAQGDLQKEVEFQARIRQFIQAQGYDGIVYRNTVEGPGDSIIAFRDVQLSIAEWQER